jgi:hypothetical protein
MKAGLLTHDASSGLQMAINVILLRPGDLSGV